MYFVKKAVVFVFVLLFFTSVKLVSAQVVINEVSPASNPEWVELYNQGSSGATLDGCTLFLHDNHSKQNISFTSSDIFEDAFKVITLTSNWLNNKGDEVSIVCSDSSDTVFYGNKPDKVVEAPTGSLTFGRSPDGSGSFFILTHATPGEQNASPPTPTPTPTNSPTPSPKPTSTPKPTKTNTPTPKPTKTIGPKPVVKSVKATALPTRKVKPQDNSENVEKSRAVLDAVRKGSDEDENENGEGEDKKLPVSAIILIVVGIGFIGTSIYLMVAKYKNRYNLKGEEKTTEKEIEL